MRPVIIAALGLLLSTPALAGQPVLEVTKTPTCGCCAGWVEHMREAGFEVRTKDVPQGLLTATKARLGIAPDFASCHTAEIGGYVVEGHVPAGDVARLLAERPEALGLAAPGMPLGSPGMETGEEGEPYDVLLLDRDGGAEVFATHGTE